MMLLTTLTGTLLFIGSVSCLGFLVLSSIRKLVHPHAPLALVSLGSWPDAFMAGAAAYTCLAFPISLLGLHISGWYFFLLCAGLMILESRHNVRQEQITPLVNPGRPSWLSLAPAAAFIAGAGVLGINYLLMTAFPQFDIDMIAHILIKSKILTDSSYNNAFFFRDTVFANVHTNYPPLPTFLFNLMFNFGLHETSSYILTNFFITLFIAISLNTFLEKHRLPPLQRSFWIMITLFTSDIIHSQFIMSSIDLPLSLTILLASLALIRTIESDDPWDQTLFSLWTGVALLIKLDALIFFGLSTLILIVYRPGFLVRHLLIITTIAGPWYLFIHSLPTPVSCGEDPFFKTISLSTLTTSAPMAFQTAFDVVLHHWNALFLIVIPATFILLWRTGYKWLPLIIILGGLTGAYGFAMWSYIGAIDAYRNTFFRLLIHVYPLAIALTALACANTRK